MPSESQTYPAASSDEGAAFSLDEATPEDAPEPLVRDEIVALDSWCTAPLGSGCTRCVAACPHQAISLDEAGPHIDESLCTRCGICLGICDGFAWSRITLEDLVARAEREAKGEGVVCFTCNEHIFPGLAPRSNVMVLPCLAAVPPEFWGALLARNIKAEVFLDRSYCDTCMVAGPVAPQLFDYALGQAQDWTGRTIAHASAIPERESILSLYANVDEADRRQIFSTLATEGMDIATGKHRQRNAGTLDEFHENQERLRAKGRIRMAQGRKDLPAVLQKKDQWPRQKLIVDAAQRMPEQAHALVRYATTTNCEECEQAHACVNVCPTAARSLDERGYPMVDARRCIACGTCVAACPNQACTFKTITAHEYCERTSHDEDA